MNRTNIEQGDLVRHVFVIGEKNVWSQLVAEAIDLIERRHLREVFWIAVNKQQETMGC